ncbi:MAG: PolC-type DNA polymerase III [Acidaminococcaceae bacterium]|nr:PolC-type DNA polymerase III [Acidaminococcaceae bacterium]
MEYSIRPDRDKTKALLGQLDLSDADSASLALLCLDELRVDADRDVWTLVWQGSMSAGLKEKLQQGIREKFGLAEVVVESDSETEPAEEAADEDDDFSKAYEALHKPKDKNLIFGPYPKGEVRAIDSLTEEENRVVIEGTFVRTLDRDGNLQSFDERELKSHAIILTFNLVDASGGIYVRLRFPMERTGDEDFALAARRECNEFKRKPKLGQKLRIKGNVAPDKFANNEMVMIPKSIAVLPQVERMDRADSKRVELHCHTKMSRMDGITPIDELITKAVKWGHGALAITDHGVVQAFPDCTKTLDAINEERKKDKLPPAELKLIYGMEGYLPGQVGDEDGLDQEADEEEKGKKKAKIPNYHIILLAKNTTGLRNLYKLVTISHLREFNRNPLLPRKLIEEYRDGLIIGSACEAGELYRAILRGDSDEKLKKIAVFYDYLEIQPRGNNQFLVRNGRCTSKDIEDYNRKIYGLGKTLGKPVVATGDVHFLNPEDAKARAVLQGAQHYKDADEQAPLFFRTTEEMLAEFEYLGKDVAMEVVVENPQKIAAMTEVLRPVPDENQLYSPHIPGAEEAIVNMAYVKAHALYGEQLPKVVEDRLKMELDSIVNHGFAVLYYIAHKLVKRSLEINYMVGSRGSVGSSFVAHMVDITEVNALQPHYRCPKCRHTEFFLKGEYASGFDLPGKNCPECGAEMARDGHDIPFAVFMGFHGDKVPDIDLNFSEVAQHYAHEYTKELFGRDNVCRAGTISTIAVRTAIGFVKKYMEERNKKCHSAYAAAIVERLQGVKRTTGQHPGGIIVVPRDMDIHYVTPMNLPSNEKKMKLNILGEYDPPTVTTHFDYHSINDRMVKLDILGHDDPGMIRHLEEIIPGLKAKDIPWGDPETMAIFTGTGSLGVKPEQINSQVGTYGIPECGTRFVRQMIADVKPTKFSDVVRVSGYSHGTDVWLNNAQDLIKEGKPVTDTISTRDDVMLHLIQAGVEPSIAFETMEFVRKGKAHKSGLKETMKEAMLKAGIPDWYMKSCETTQYLFPKAHAVAYVMMAYRIAYCKVHYPKEFYAAYFSERAEKFDYTLVQKGKEFLKNFINDTYALGYKAEKSAQDSVPYLELVVEMMERGIGFEALDIYESDPVNFLPTEKGIRPPLAALPGVGKEAAKALGRAIKEAKKNNMTFISREDMASRTGVGRSIVDKLAEVGALGDLPEENTISLF